MTISEEKLEKWQTAFDEWMNTAMTPMDEMLEDFALKNIGKTDGQFFRSFVAGYESAIAYMRSQRQGG